MKFVHQPAPANRLGDYLKANLSGSWTQFRAAVAFVKRSGTKHIVSSLGTFAKENQVEIIVGIDHRGTSFEGLSDLVEAVGSHGRVIVFHNRLPYTFHPKIYLFKSDTAAEVILGSGNLTEGGLFTNYEAAFRLSFDLTDSIEAAELRAIEDVLDTWADPARGTAQVLDETFLNRLVGLGLVPLEIFATDKRDTIAPQSTAAGNVEDEVKTETLFAARTEPRAPTTPRATKVEEVSKPRTGTKGSVMTLQKTDVGVGQTTTGTARRSPEIFIPLSARNANPGFWEWPDAFTPDLNKQDKRDRSNVRMSLGGQIISVNMMTWPDKHDFRLRSEALRSAGSIGDILRMEKVDDLVCGFEYYVEIVPKGTTQFSVYRALCTVPVRNSNKHYGYY